MKHTFTKKAASLFLTSALCLTATAAVPASYTAFAAIDDSAVIEPYNIAITTTGNSCYKISSTQLKCTGTTSVQSGYKARVIVELQIYDSGWTTIKTWSHTGSATAGVDKTPTITTSGKYRLKLTHEALNSAGTSVVETITKYSDSVDF